MAVLCNEVYDNSLTVEQIWKNFEYAEKHIPDLSKPFIVDDFNYEITNDPEKWTKDYFFEASSCLGTNFNGKRFKNVLQARDHLRKTGNPEFKHTS